MAERVDNEPLGVLFAERVVRGRHTETHDRLPLQLVRNADYSSLGNLRTLYDRGFNLCRPIRFPATLIVSSERPGLYPESICVDVCPVAMHPHIGNLTPVGLQVPLGILPETSRHPDPRRADDQLTYLIDN